MDAKMLIKRAKQQIKILENYYIPRKTKVGSVYAFLEKIIEFEYEHIEILDSTLQSVFDVLCKDLVRQAENLAKTIQASNYEDVDLDEAKNLLFLVIGVENYLSAIARLPWEIGRKVSFREKMNIRSIFRKKLHSLYDPLRKIPVRGTKVKVIITGSLAAGASDWKMIAGGFIPKPSDYGLPKEYRKATKSIYRKLDEDLNVPVKLKPKMADVDILIMSEVIYYSLDPVFKQKTWLYKLGEKYQTGVGASPILDKLHQGLLNTKIGGISGRWVNYVVIKDEESYERYMQSRRNFIKGLEKQIGKKIKIRDAMILDEVIR